MMLSDTGIESYPYMNYWTAMKYADFERNAEFDEVLISVE